MAYDFQRAEFLLKLLHHFGLLLILMSSNDIQNLADRHVVFELIFGDLGRNAEPDPANIQIAN